LESLNPREQARIFYSARLLIGPQGSGMTNLIFSQPGASVLEIDLEIGRRCTATQRMCSNLDLHYIPYVCTSDYVGRFPQSRSQTFPSGGPVDFPGDYHIDDVEEFVSVASEEINRSQPVNFVLVSGR
jgi:Glycosyltransferase 61